MKSQNIALSTGLALISGTYANKDVITLNANGNSWIQEAVATLVVPDIPGTVSGDIALWSAIMMDDYNGDFLQGVTQSSPASISYCADAEGDWCNFAYTLKGSSPTVGDALVAQPGSRIKTHYKLNPSTNEWDQNLYVDDVLKSSVSTSKGQHGTTFFVSIECASGTCADAPAHSWENISLVLNEADATFGQTGSWEFDASGGEMSTSDEGKTWNFTTLSVPETPIQHE